MTTANDPSENDPEIQIEIPTRRGPEPITSAALHGAGYTNTTSTLSGLSQNDDLPVVMAPDADDTPEKNAFLAFFEWYIWPYQNVIYCLKCVLYHFLNWLFMLKMFVFACVYIPLDLGLIVLACVGLLLFYISFEYQILMSWIDLAMNFYLVEDDPVILSQGRPKLGYPHLPECGDCQNRIKTVMASAQTYKSMIYYLIFKPVVVWVTSCSLILLIGEGGLLSFWIIVAAHPEWFKHAQPQWDVGKAFGVFIGGVFLLPFALYIVIWTAKASKVTSYFFLTNMYADRSAEETSLLNNQPAATEDTSGQLGRQDILAV